MQYFDELCLIEDTHELWQAEMRGLHLWTVLRTRTLLEVVRRRENYQVAHVSTTRLQRLNFKMLPYHLKTIQDVFLSSKKSYRALIFKKARNYNIYKYFYQRIPESLILEESWKNNISVEMWQNQQAILWDSFVILASIGRRRIKLTAQEQANIREFVALVTDTYDLQDQFETYCGHLTRSVQSAIIMRSLLRQYIIPKLDGKLAIIQQSYYSGSFAVITRVLREHGITVAEPQHGVIYKGHAPYTYSANAVSNPTHPIRHYHPDFLLLFGKYWQSNIVIPGKSYIIGYPHLSETATKSQTVNDKAVLVISQGVSSDLLGEITEQAAKAHPDYQFIYKLHPEEIGFQDRYTYLRQLPNVTIIDYLSDVHGFLSRCRNILGFTSTVLFEALAYPGRRVFIVHSEAFYDDIISKLGTVFKTAEEFIFYLDDPAKGTREYDASDVWHPDWEDNLNRFLSMYIEL